MFEWDEEKSPRNLAQRGFDFEFVCRIFEGDIIEQEDTRRDYGERRRVALGEVEGNVFAVVYTWREGRYRIISARLANRRERNVYRRALGQRDREKKGQG